MSWHYRYDAHPMSMLTSAFAMLGSYYSEANPSLQGEQNAVGISTDIDRAALCRATLVYQGGQGLARDNG